MKTLRVLFLDQLSHNISSLRGLNVCDDTIFLCESLADFTNVKHHKKKIAFIVTAARHFCIELKKRGFKVVYKLLEKDYQPKTYSLEIEQLVKNNHFDQIVVTHPSEYRQLQEVQQWEQKFNIPLKILEDTRFLCTHEEFKKFAANKKTLRMEFFYREMRQKYNILMRQNEPCGGKWNYDSENRKSPRKDLNVPKILSFEIDDIAKDALSMVKNLFPSHFGDLEPFYFAKNRNEALQVLDHFIKYRLFSYGDYQDAMVENEPWMFHSHLSFYINCGLIDPLECVSRVEEAYNHGLAPLNAVEGYIRQIIGWREYVRGIYWLKMPSYESMNFFNANRSLPDLYWSGDTPMNCMKQCVLETKKHAYAHHIQRLMVLGNFALIAGISPDEVNNWYHIVYADAYQWVELPNVTGMILFADGGFLASKPYAAGGAYINKMSDYCKNCSFKVSVKTGQGACPFNYLYWDFLQRNRDKLSSNHRIGMMYRTYDKMSDDKKIDIRESARNFFETI